MSQYRTQECMTSARGIHILQLGLNADSLFLTMQAIFNVSNIAVQEIAETIRFFSLFQPLINK